MTTTDEWIKTCINKKRYTEVLADKVIKKVLSERNTQLYKYPCNHCGGWHLTNKIRAEVVYGEKLSIVESEMDALKEELKNKNLKVEELEKDITKFNKFTDGEKKAFKYRQFIRRMQREMDILKSKNGQLRKDYESVFNRFIALQKQING